MSFGVVVKGYNYIHKSDTVPGTEMEQLQIIEKGAISQAMIDCGEIEFDIREHYNRGFKFQVSPGIFEVLPIPDFYRGSSQSGEQNWGNL